MKSLLRKIISRQTGFSLIDMLIAIAITGILGTGAASITYQIFHQHDRASRNMETVQEVENVSFWLNRDALQAQTVTTTESGSKFPLFLQWTDHNGKITTVKYSLSGSDLIRKVLEKAHVSGTEVTVSETIIAGNINVDISKTYCTYNSTLHQLILTVTSTSGSTSLTRTYEITCRPSKPI